MLEGETEQEEAMVKLELPAGVEGVIFDCDGTLADTMPLHYRAWVEALRARKAEMPEQLFYALGGVPTADIVRILNDRFGYGLDVESTAADKEARYEVLLPQAQPVER